MNELRFEWDDRKNRINRRKHGVSFEEAVTIFDDEKAILYGDPAHSQDEDRFLLLGRSSHLRIVTVSHCYRENDSLIRIISARKADAMEERDYLEGLQ